DTTRASTTFRWIDVVTPPSSSATVNTTGSLFSISSSLSSLPALSSSPTSPASSSLSQQRLGYISLFHDTADSLASGPGTSPPLAASLQALRHLTRARRHPGSLLNSSRGSTERTNAASTEDGKQTKVRALRRLVGRSLRDSDSETMSQSLDGDNFLHSTRQNYTAKPPSLEVRHRPAALTTSRFAVQHTLVSRDKHRRRTRSHLVTGNNGGTNSHSDRRLLWSLTGDARDVSSSGRLTRSEGGGRGVVVSRLQLEQVNDADAGIYVCALLGGPKGRPIGHRLFRLGVQSGPVTGGLATLAPNGGLPSEAEKVGESDQIEDDNAPTRPSIGRQAHFMRSQKRPTETNSVTVDEAFGLQMSSGLPTVAWSTETGLADGKFIEGENDIAGLPDSLCRSP
ncbi:unnamed protein product, partial [Protopolystoma xenopodis]